MASAANNVKLLTCHTVFLQNVSREGDFQRFNAFALYEQYGYALTQERPSKGHEIYNFGRGFRSHHYYLQWILDIMLMFIMLYRLLHWKLLTQITFLV